MTFNIAGPLQGQYLETWQRSQIILPVAGYARQVAATAWKDYVMYIRVLMIPAALMVIWSGLVLLS